MTVEELKNNPKYEFECNINPSNYIGKNTYDDWGAGFIWINDVGVEYNICKDYGEDLSAIYYTEIGDDGYMHTSYSLFVPYEIDFNDPNWEENFETALCNGMIAVLAFRNKGIE